MAPHVGKFVDAVSGPLSESRCQISLLVTERCSTKWARRATSNVRLTREMHTVVEAGRYCTVTKPARQPLRSPLSSTVVITRSG